MTDPIRGGSGPVRLDETGLPPERERLRKAAHEFEAVFIAQMFKEMRATIPADEAAPGSEMFTGLLDEKLASQAAGKSTGSLGEALYRQLATRFLSGPADAGNGTGNGNGSE